MIDSVISRLDKIEERLHEVSNNLVRQTVSLELHMERTDALEEQLIPLQKKVNAVDSILKFIGLLLTISSTVIGIFAAIKAVI